MVGKFGSVTLIVLCQIAAMTLWFSATAAASAMVAAGELSGQQTGLLTSSVQLGFVAGTLLSALFGLADRTDPRRLFMSCALFGAAFNALLLVVGLHAFSTVILRFLTGCVLAGIYPVGMKMAVGWTDKGVGLMIGTLVGALTLGSSLPHLFNAMFNVDWRLTIVVSTLCALLAAIGIRFVGLGPYHRKSSSFRIRDVTQSFFKRPILLANIGYLGHMWELYAMWAWIGVFLGWALHRLGHPLVQHVGEVTFLVIAMGAVGSVVAGFLADRFGRTLVTIVVLSISGSCAAVIGFMPALGVWPLLAVAVVWGITVVADSAQFSACVAELAEPELVGTMLTVQTFLGFLLTFLIIQGIPVLLAAISWKYAFGVLAVGPVFGALAMSRLRRHPASVRLAGGRR